MKLKLEKEICPTCKGIGIDENVDPEFSLCQTCYGRGKLKTKISNEELDVLTLKCTQVLFDSGIELAAYNESNNDLRRLLKKHLTEWCDFDIAYGAEHKHTIWDDIRKKLNLPNPFKK